ncbi:MAG TPA: HlyD family secretion protein [Candidatus Dormibacteraeota bacterium]|nr:HlyD family secretion protein [Candidatus Dormibacteraeota bacterium]
MPQPTDVENPPAARPESPTHGEERSSAPPPRSRASRFFHDHPAARWLLFAGLLALVVGGYFAWRYFSSYQSTDDAQIDGYLYPVSARISGYVSNVFVTDNQVVKAGQVLVEIDPRDYQVAIDQARAALQDAQATARAAGISVPVTTISTRSQISTAEAEVDNAQAAISASRQQLNAERADLTSAEANNTRAQRDLQRYKELVAKKEISEQQYDQAVATAASTAASVQAARAGVSGAQQAITQAKARLAQAEADVRAAQTGPQQVRTTQAKAQAALATVAERQAALEQAELNLQYTKIVAPVDGEVIRNVEVGMNVQPGQQLLTVAPIEGLWVTADFKETQLKGMRPGQPAEISVDANGRTYKGHVDSIAGSTGAKLSLLPPENATGNYVKVVQRIPVKILINSGQNNDHYLRIGMSVEPKVYLK